MLTMKNTSLDSIRVMLFEMSVIVGRKIFTGIKCWYHVRFTLSERNKQNSLQQQSEQVVGFTRCSSFG